MQNQYVSFNLSSEQYAIPIQYVEAIIKMQKLTHMPQAPAYVEGVTNLRGAVLPVIDLRKRLGLPAEEYNLETRIIVIQVEEKKIGLIVDAVHAVLTLSSKQIDPTPALVTRLDSEFISGIAKTDQQLLILLEISGIFSSTPAPAALPRLSAISR